MAGRTCLLLLQTLLGGCPLLCVAYFLRSYIGLTFFILQIVYLAVLKEMLFLLPPL